MGMSEAATRLRVIYIVGYPRSGSTAVCQLLGTSKDLLSFGGTKFLWAAYSRDEQCSGGERLTRGRAWGFIGDGPSLESIVEFDPAQDRASALRRFPRLVAGTLG